MPTAPTHEPAGTPARVRLHLVALPVEHGGWGLLLEPIVLGFAVASTAAGTLLGVAAAAALIGALRLTSSAWGPYC